MATRYLACTTGDVSPGRQAITRVANRSIGVFQIGDAYHALINVCPHKGAALCEGPVTGTTSATDGYDFNYGQENALVRCAHHGWEFDIATGACLVDPKVKARSLPVSVDGDKIYVEL